MPKSLPELDTYFISIPMVSPTGMINNANCKHGIIENFLKERCLDYLWGLS